MNIYTKSLPVRNNFILFFTFSFLLLAFCVNPVSENAKEVVSQVYSYYDTLYTSLQYSKIIFTDSINYNREDLTTIDLPQNAIMRGDTLLWIPQDEDIGNHTARFLVKNNNIQSYDTLVQYLQVVKPAPEQCPYYDKYYVSSQASPQELPEGYIVHNIDKKNGLWCSKVYPYRPYLIPNTSSDQPVSLDISPDGKWVLYLEQKTNKIFCIMTSGKYKTSIPIIEGKENTCHTCGFYRESPYGLEIYYISDRQTIRSILVEFIDTNIITSKDRIIAKLSTKYSIADGPAIALDVHNDIIFGNIGQVINDTVFPQSNFITIKNQGKQTATDADIYSWKNNIPKQYWGCGHTISHSGLYTLSNPGGVGGTLNCLPRSHDGFCITPPRRISDEKIVYVIENQLTYGTSINWIPFEYRKYSREEMDFWGWNFSNIDELVAGRSLGSRKLNAVWITEWKSNTWYQITSFEYNVRPKFVAAWFGDLSSVPLLKGESPFVWQDDTTEKKQSIQILNSLSDKKFSSGDTCTITILTSKSESVYLTLYTDQFETFEIPSLNSAFNPNVTPTVAFVIPDSFFINGIYIDATQRRYKIFARDYSSPNEVWGKSDGWFEILKL